MASASPPGYDRRTVLTKSETDKIKSRVRVCVLKVLTKMLREGQDSPKRDDPFINELVLDYFKWIGYTHSEEALLKDTKHASRLAYRVSLQDDLELPHGAQGEPALLSVISIFKKDNLNLFEETIGECKS